MLKQSPTGRDGDVWAKRRPSPAAAAWASRAKRAFCSSPAIFFQGREFQGAGAPQLCILGLVDHAHPALAELFGDAQG